jgi:MFS family permease
MHGAMSGLRVAGPLLALKMGHTPFEVGLLFSLFGLSQIFLALHAGKLADRHSFKSIVMGAVGVCVCSIGLAAAFPSYWALCLASLGSGGAVGYALVALQRHAGRMAANPAELKKVFSWLGVGPAVSNFVGPVVAGLLIDHVGFRAAFAALAAFPFITWVLVRGVRAETVHAASGDAADSGPWELLKNPQFRRLLAVNWVLSSCWDAHSFMVPIIGHEFGFSASTIGTVVGSFALAVTGIRLVLPAFADKLVEWKVIFGVSVACAAILALYPFLQHPVLMVIGSVTLGSFLGMTQPMMLSTMHQITPENRQGAALGIRMAVTNAASVVMPLGFGALGAAVGVKAVFWGVASLALGGSFFAKGLKLASQPATPVN